MCRRFHFGDFPAFNWVARLNTMSRLAGQVEMSRKGLYTALSENGSPNFNSMIKIIQASEMRLSVAS